MTVDGAFREPAPRPATLLDRTLARVGGIALLLMVVAGGLALASVAVTVLAVLVPVVLVAGLVGFGTLWWQARRGRGGAAGALMQVLASRRR